MHGADLHWLPCTFQGAKHVMVSMDAVLRCAFGKFELVTAAFDRDDALYLRDEAEKARHRELALRDAELGKFSRVQSEQDAAGPFDTGGAAGPAIKRARYVKYALHTIAQILQQACGPVAPALWLVSPICIQTCTYSRVLVF